MLRPEDSRAWLAMLFRPGDVFEARVRRTGDRGAEQFWVPFERLEQFVDVHLPIHARGRKHVWVGVAPRVAEKNSAPRLHRALWVDFEAGVTTPAQVADAVTAASLPTPSMVVNSGNGMHAYWRLDGDYAPAEVLPRSRALHHLLPADDTFDCARVMRVPGTPNPKSEPPTESFIVYHEPERVYPLSVFPVQEAPSANLSAGANPDRIIVPLSDADRELFVSRWVEGQKHYMAVAVSGYLRAGLYYGQAAALAEIRRIHEAAGFSWEADGAHLSKVVEDTYKQMLGKVAGAKRLAELGAEPSVAQGVTYAFKRPPKRRVELIDFASALTPQEFWLAGLVGPGLVTLWAAEPKVGKSMAVMQLGHALAFGHSIWGFGNPGVPKNVLYFQGELSKGMVYERAKELFGLHALRDVSRFAMTDKPAETLSLIEHPEALTDLAEGYDVIIVDPISAFNSNDENTTGSVRDTLSVFDQLTHAGKAVILVHHSRKLQTDAKGNSVIPSFNDIRGAGQWFAAADAIALQYRLKDSPNCRVKFEFRAAPPREELTLFRLPNGGFTADKGAYLRTLGTAMRVDVSGVN